MFNKLKTHGITEKTPENILLGAGTFYKNLKYDETKDEWDGAVLGATSGGGKLNITPEYYTPDVDGATVRVSNMTWKVSEVATVEVNLIEMSEGVIVDTLHLKEDLSAPPGYKKYVGVKNLSKEHYLDNISYVGTLTDGRQVIIVLNNAICLGAMELAPANKEANTYTVTFECTASFEQDNLEQLPYEFYYPQAETVEISQKEVSQTENKEILVTDRKEVSRVGGNEKK